MLKKNLYFTLVLPLFFIFPTNQSKSNDLVKKENNNIEKIINNQFVKYDDIPKLLKNNNFELKALEKMVKSASFNYTSSLGKKYPSIDLSASGLPQYLYGKNYNSNAINTKSSQFKVNPALTIRWDLINPTREPDIDSAQNNLRIAINNYEVKKNDLIQEAKSTYHLYQKSLAEINNANSTVNLSLKSLKDAKSKLETGIGTEFDVLEAEAQLARDKQILEDKKTFNEINKISLKEVLNLDFEKDIEISKKQKLLGFWNHSLKTNLKEGIANSFSLKNLNLQRSIKNNQAKRFKNSNKPIIYLSNTLTSSFSRGSTLTEEIDPKKTGSNYSNTISLNLSWNIFDGNQNNNSAKAKQSEAQADMFNYQNLENTLRKNISETYLNLRKFEKQIISTKSELISTTESLRLARLRYEVGVSTLKDVLTRQQELSNANLKNIDSIYNYTINLDRLERLTFQKRSGDCLLNKSDNKNQLNPLCNY